MAIWQYSFLVIPKVVLDKGGLKSHFDKDGFLDDEECWLIQPINVDFFNDIEKILPKNKSWSDEIVLFGDQDLSCFEVYKNENNEVVSVSFKIDYTSDYEEILRSIIHFISINGFVLLDENLKIIDNNIITIKSLIENSDQRTVYDKLKRKEE